MTLTGPPTPPSSPAGKVEKKEHILDERDALFVELRHQHFAAVSLKISSLMDEFRSKNKAAKAGAGGVGDLNLRNMSKLIQSLPQYRDKLAKMGAHVEIASKINSQIDSNHLTELGKLEQDLVYGDATSKEVIAFLTTYQAIPAADKASGGARALLLSATCPPLCPGCFGCRSLGLFEL